MAINKFDKFVTSDYVSQYVPFPMQEVMGMAQYMQQDFDQKEAQKELMLNQLRSQKVLTKDVADRDVFYKQTNEEINALLDKFGGNIRDKNAWKELKQKMTDVTFDPKVSAWSANYNAYQELEKQKSELIKQGKYFEANNLQNMMQWKGFEKTVGPDGEMNYLNFSEITPMIDVRGEVEKRIDAKKSSGEIREDGTGMYITEHGKEGVTYDEIYNSVYNDLMNENTPVGQQMRMNAEYNMYNQDREKYFTNAYKQGDYQYLQDTETFKQLGNTFNELGNQYKTIETTGVNPYTGKKLSDKDKTTLLSSIKDKQEEYQTYLNNPQSYFMQKEIKDVAASLGFEYSFMRTKDSQKLNSAYIKLLDYQRQVQNDAIQNASIIANTTVPGQTTANPFADANKQKKLIKPGEGPGFWEYYTQGLDGPTKIINFGTRHINSVLYNLFNAVGVGDKLVELADYSAQNKDNSFWAKVGDMLLNPQTFNNKFIDTYIKENPFIPVNQLEGLVTFTKTMKNLQETKETEVNQTLTNLDNVMAPDYEVTLNGVKKKYSELSKDQKIDLYNNSIDNSYVSDPSVNIYNSPETITALSKSIMPYFTSGDGVLNVYGEDGNTNMTVQQFMKEYDLDHKDMTPERIKFFGGDLTNTNAPVWTGSLVKDGKNISFGFSMQDQFRSLTEPIRLGYIEHNNPSMGTDKTRWSYNEKNGTVFKPVSVPVGNGFKTRMEVWTYDPTTLEPVSKIAEYGLEEYKTSVFDAISNQMVPGITTSKKNVSESEQTTLSSFDDDED